MPDPATHTPGGTFTLAGRPVARIGYGAMRLESAGSSQVASDRRAALDVVRRAVALGVNHLDTASFYGDCVVNELIHDALAPYPANLTIVSKVGAAYDEHARPIRVIAAQRPEELRAAVEADLRTLGSSASMSSTCGAWIARRASPPRATRWSTSTISSPR